MSFFEEKNGILFNGATGFYVESQSGYKMWCYKNPKDTWYKLKVCRIDDKFRRYQTIGYIKDVEAFKSLIGVADDNG